MANIRQTNLIDLVPDSIKSDPQVQAAAAAIDNELQAVTADIPVTMLIARLDELPEAVIDLLAWQWHVDYYEPVGMDIGTKRKLVRQSIAWHQRKGTPSIVKEIVSSVLGSATVSEWFNYGGDPYYFRITTAAYISNKNVISQLISMINTVKNTRSWLEKIIIESTYQSGWYFGGIVFDTETIVINLPAISDQTAIANCYYGGAIYINEKMEVGNG